MVQDKDEFEPVSNQDEFEEVTDTNEFSEVIGQSEFEQPGAIDTTVPEEVGINWDMLYWPLGALAFTILAGFLVRFRPTRTVRGVLLTGSVIFLGFYNGACPCPISSLSNTFIGAIGGDAPWEAMVWFLGLIPVTFVFGKVWCGWICHLGALQEFIYRSDKLKFLRGNKAQIVMKVMRWALLVTLIVQLIYTQTYLFDEIDPFRTAFNLGFGTSLTGWILLGLMLLSSVFIYRPFCKAACPIGLLLGFVAKIPGASVLGAKEICTGCVTCSKACKYDAIVRKDKYSVLDNTECILCGECIDQCRQNGILFYRKGKKHGDKVILEACSVAADNK